MTVQITKRTAVQFGAGSVGRGFLGQLFCEAGLETVFIDTDNELIDALNRAHQYQLEIVGMNHEVHLIQPVRAVEACNLADCAQAVADATIACTAVGAHALDAAALTIAEGLQRRFLTQAEPLNILVCENLPHADTLLRDAVKQRLPAEFHAQLDSSVGFVRTVVARMTPVATAEQRLRDVTSIRTEEYKTLPVDKDAVVGVLPRIPGIEAVGCFQSEIDRKLFAHNGAHAVLGYLGWKAGVEFGWQALQVPYIAESVAGALNEVSQALHKEWGVPSKVMADYCDDLVRRFANRDLGDTCIRLCRDPQRKLAHNDRLVGAASLCYSHGVSPIYLARGIAAALTYLASPNSLEIMISQEHAAELLMSTSGLSANDPLTTLVLDQLAQLPRGRGDVQ